MNLDLQVIEAQQKLLGKQQELLGKQQERVVTSNECHAVNR